MFRNRTRVCLRRTDIHQIVSVVLARGEIAQYLHPGSPGRLPVKISIAAPYSDARPAMVLYGHPVAVVTEASDAVRFKISRTLHGAKVEVSYRPEGMVGTVLLRRSRDRWIAKRAHVYEH